MREQGVINVHRIKVRHDGTLKDTNTSAFTFNTSVLPKQLKVAFLRVSFDPYIPNPLRCYACQVFGHHEKKCRREQMCANCGEPKHSADEGGGRVVRWCWVNFQCRGVLLIWIRVGQGPSALAVGAGGGCLDIFTLVYHFSSLSPSLGDGPI